MAFGRSIEPKAISLSGSRVMEVTRVSGRLRLLLVAGALLVLARDALLTDLPAHRSDVAGDRPAAEPYLLRTRAERHRDSR